MGGIVSVLPPERPPGVRACPQRLDPWAPLVDGTRPWARSMMVAMIAGARGRMQEGPARFGCGPPPCARAGAAGRFLSARGGDLKPVLCWRWKGLETW